MAAHQPIPIVVTTQPGGVTEPLLAHVAPPAPREWSSGLYNCFDDCAICWAVLLFGTCYECHLAKEMGEHCCVGCCTPAAVIPLRVKLRMQENIQGSICNDTKLAFFCGPCALCQLGREVKAVKQRAASAGVAYVAQPVYVAPSAVQAVPEGCAAPAVSPVATAAVIADTKAPAAS